MLIATEIGKMIEKKDSNSIISFSFSMMYESPQLLIKYKANVKVELIKDPRCHKLIPCIYKRISDMNNFNMEISMH